MSQVDTLDTQKLAEYLEQHIDGFKGPIEADKFEGGQSNPTFKITAASGSYVLRRQPPGNCSSLPMRWIASSASWPR